MEKFEWNWVKADAKDFAESAPKTEAREAAEAEANYRMNLECAEIALSDFKGLTAEDREDIEIAVTRLKLGWALLHEEHPIQLRQAAHYLMFAAHVIGSRCTVCESEKEYWRRDKCSKGGKKTNPDTQKWKDWAMAIIVKNPEVKASKMTESLLEEKSKPSNLPGYDYLVKFVRLARKRAAKKGRPARLVHSA